MKNVKELQDDITKLGVDMRAIIEKCKTESREKMNSEEELRFDTMYADQKALEKQRDRMQAIDDMEQPTGRRTEPRMERQETESRGDSTAMTPADAKRVAGEHEEAMRAWFASHLDVPLNQRQEGLIKRYQIVPKSKELKLRRPSERLRSDSMQDAERYEQRSLSTLTSTSPEDGSYLIANEAMLPLERALLAYGGVRGVSTVLRTRTGANLPIPTSNDTSNEGALLSENTQAVEKDTEFGQLVLNAFKFTSKKVLISRELFQDSNEDLGVFMFSALGERLARIMNRYATTGTGSSQPNGIVTAATSSGTTLAAKTPTYLELVATEGGLDPAYRTGASWMFHDTELQEIKKIVETTTGRPIWLPLMTGMQGAAPDTILGYPYTINQHMDVAASSGSGKSILFGNMRKYLYREVQDITIMRLDELYAEYYQVAFVAFSRMDGDLLDAGTHPVVYTANHS